MRFAVGNRGVCSANYAFTVVQNFFTIDPASAHPEGITDATLATQMVAWAQTNLKLIFNEIGIDASTAEPKGPLGYPWGMPAGQSATFMINLAITLVRLRERMTTNSQELFRSKIRLLMSIRDENAFEELLVELEIGSKLAILCSPIFFEALVPKTVQRIKNKPSSADYGIKYQDTPILVEATVWHWEDFAAWGRLQSVIHEALQNRVYQKGEVERSVRLELPVKANSSVRDELTNQAFCDRIARDEYGVQEFDVGCELPARITWEPLVHVHRPGGMPGLEETEEIVQTVSGIPIGAGAGGRFFNWLVNPCLTQASLEDALKSIRKSIDRKKRQAGTGSPFVLALSLANAHMNWDMFSGIVSQRLWQNPKYDWISGILEYKPERFKIKPLDDIGLRLNVNPRALHPLPGSLISGQMWHLPDEWMVPPAGGDPANY